MRGLGLAMRSSGSPQEGEPGARLGRQPGAEVVIKGVSKSFGSTQALTDVSLNISPGAIHALVGANGAGKSTLLGILAGRVAPTEGNVLIGGDPLAPGQPRAAARLGVAAIYQELTIVPAMSAIENVFLGSAVDRRRLLISPAAARRRYAELCERAGARIPASSLAGTLSVPDQQLLEIMRCVHKEASVILLDEPTSALAQAERERLFRIMRDLRSEGRTLVFVSHDLDEVLDISDTIAVFRNGRLVDRKEASAWSKERMIETMLGDAYETYASRAKEQRPQWRAEPSQTVEVQGLRVRPGAPEISFSAHVGEVLGLAGLAGSGRSTLLRALAGDLPGAAGRLVLRGAAHKVPRSAPEGRKLGIALVPEDRKRMGLVMQMTARENVILPKFGGVRGQFGLRAFAREAAEGARRVGFATEALRLPAQALSGGNQQKLLLARWAAADIQLLLADEPTRGVDVGAKVSILETLQALARRGMAVLVASSELEDLDEVCDRVLVMRTGRPVAILSRSEGNMTIDNMLALSFQ